jgi:hypothetical protein
MGKSIFSMVMKKFRINKYSQIYNRIGPHYGGLAKFIIINQYGGVPGERYNFGFTNVKCHAVSNAPTLYRANARMQ